jgi:hypothetical protein
MKKLVFLVIPFTVLFSLLLIGCDPTDPPIEMCTVTTEVVGSGTVDPIVKTLEKGGDVNFNIVPQEGFKLVSIKIDGNDVDSRNLDTVYVLKNVSSNHKISFLFEEKQKNGFFVILGKNGYISSCNIQGPDDESSIYLQACVGESITFTVKPYDGFVVDTFMVGGVMKTLSPDNTYTTVTAPVYINMDRVYITFKMDIKYGTTEWFLTQGKWNCDSIFIYNKNENHPEGAWLHYPYGRRFIYSFLENGVVIKDFNDQFNDNYIFSYDWKYKNGTLDISGGIYDLEIINDSVFMLVKKNDFILYFTKIK